MDIKENPYTSPVYLKYFPQGIPFTSSKDNNGVRVTTELIKRAHMGFYWVSDVISSSKKILQGYKSSVLGTLLSSKFIIKIEEICDNGQICWSTDIMADPAVQYDTTFELSKGNDRGIFVVSVYSQDGGYVGSVQDAWNLYLKGIVPQKIQDDSRCCSIGWCEKEQKWFGWSHWAMSSFQIGSTVVKGDCAFTPSNPEELLEDIRSFWGIDSKDILYMSTSVKPAELQTIVQHLYDEGRIEYLPKALIPEDVEHNYTGAALLTKDRCLYQAYPHTWGHGEWFATTLDDAKQMAIDFAGGVA